MVFRGGKPEGTQLSRWWQALRNNRWIGIGCRWLLGVTFIYASMHKIADPAAFAKIVYGYGLFPGQWINLIAIILPFVELFAGLALVFGLWRRAATMIIVGMLLSFILAISINLARGYEFDCGCFPKSTEGLFLLSGSPWSTLIRDILLLLIAIFSLASRKHTGVGKNSLHT